MADRAAASLLRRAWKASGRFVVEVAVSFVATLCVTLALSGWWRPGSASLASHEAAPASSGSPVIASSPAKTSPWRATDAGADAKETRADAWVTLPLLVEKDLAQKDEPAAGRALQPVSINATSGPRPRSSSHLTAAASHNQQASCAPVCPGHSANEASAKVGNLELPLRPARADPQAEPAAPASSSEEDRRPTVLGFALPTIPVHAVLSRPLRPVLQGASSVTELLSGLAGKP